MRKAIPRSVKMSARNEKFIAKRTESATVAGSTNERERTGDVPWNNDLFTPGWQTAD